MFKSLYSKAASSICNNNNIARIEQKIYLMFHSIEHSAFNNSIYHMDLNRFKDICKLLHDIRLKVQAEYGYSVEFVFTFDDGYHNYIENALPVLDQYSYQSIVFVIAGNVYDQSGKYINIDDLKSLQMHPRVKIGMHGYSHSDLSSLTKDALKEELNNIMEVCDKINFNTNYFSLPFGRANRNVISKLVECGFIDIFTSDYGTKIYSKNGVNKYPRIDIWSNDSDDVIKQKIMKYWKLFFIIESLRSKLYRI
jgi:peptidoglycan/xylan/chitin deacetylase (PgdA/CDA1 family)